MWGMMSESGGRLDLSGQEKHFPDEEDLSLETTRTRLSRILKRHAELSERLSRDSDKIIFERVQKEFDSARASQSSEIFLDGEQWNDGLLATIRERVHIEADKKAMAREAGIFPGSETEERITYRVRNKVICCLEGARFGVQYETFFAGEPCEIYHIILESKSFLEKMTVAEHTIPFFLPVREAESDLLSTNAMKFIDHVGDLLQAYVDRREQVRLIKELYGNQIGELYHSLPYHMVEFTLAGFECKIIVTLRYTDLTSVLPNRVRVMAWPKTRDVLVDQQGNGYPESHHALPSQLSYAEEALRSMSLPEGFAEIVLNLPQALQQLSTGGPPASTA
ncbi:hypothetical protein MLD38_008793 [Melastoma candidum]|uniref:Uncharacterized protein n=1 Tax=Melastoma candidum TaxID=119954 RepID=A0ACB9RUM2_9MYRT|nr:hypothetical protein MLD38_008793 [Melastoma candidum]